MLLMITTLVIALECALIVGLYYLRAHSMWTPASSDLIAFYLPPLLAALICGWASHALSSSGGHARSLSVSIAWGGGASAIGAIIGFLFAFNLWGT